MVNDAPLCTATLVATLAARLLERGAMLVTAESCTGGLVAAACTDRTGSSAWFERGIVSYSNDAKRELLGVPPGLIETHGAVSEAVVRAMAEGALARTPRADLAVAVTGIAGPDGGSAAKPVGTVWLGCAARSGRSTTRLHQGRGDRAAIRASSVDAAIVLVLEVLEDTALGP